MTIRDKQFNIVNSEDIREQVQYLLHSEKYNKQYVVTIVTIEGVKTTLTLLPNGFYYAQKAKGKQTVKELLEDTVEEVNARMRGWATIINREV